MKQISSDLPNGVLLTYYGDDFTGSTDVLEAFTAAGISTVLFLHPPRPNDLLRFKDVRCVGLAGQSRGKDPAWMRQHLPEIFQQLSAFGAPLLQYKICSTFDSSAQVGSIGQAIDIGMSVTSAGWSPMVVGAPRLRRYQIFGHLFATANGTTYRIDRHPTMSRHPVTPMNEADLRLHLAKQTNRRIALIDVAELAEQQAQYKLDLSLDSDQPIVMIDVADTTTQIEAGRLIWENSLRAARPLFSASSSGLQYALTAYWREQGLLSPAKSLPLAEPVSCIAVVSGSCSPVSGEQIEWARANGFKTERLDIAKTLNPEHTEHEIVRLTQQAVSAIAQNISPIVYSAQGPDDPAVMQFDALAQQASLTRAQAAQRVGEVLAEIMRRILDQSSVRRIVVAGGDSSGAVGSHLGIQALTMSAAITPGVPLCRAWSTHANRDGLEIAFKGGQMGRNSFYGEVRAGHQVFE